MGSAARDTPSRERKDVSVRSHLASHPPQRMMRSRPWKGSRRATRWHPCRRAFITHEGFQCGILYLEGRSCRKDLLKSHGRVRTRSEGMHERKSCRCGCLSGIVAAIKDRPSQRERLRPCGPSTIPGADIRRGDGRMSPQRGRALHRGGTNQSTDELNVETAAPGRGPPRGVIESTPSPKATSPRDVRSPRRRARLGELVTPQRPRVDQTVKEQVPCFPNALLSGASGQIRQHGRRRGRESHARHASYYFRVHAMPMHKRDGPSTGLIGRSRRQTAFRP